MIINFIPSSIWKKTILQFQSCVIHGHEIWISVNGKLLEGVFLHAEATQDGQPTRYILLASP